MQILLLAGFMLLTIFASSACSCGRAAIALLTMSVKDMAELIICLQNDVTDLAELQHAHMQYLEKTHNYCLMSQTTREVRAIIEPVLRCIVDFTNSCRYVCGTAYALSIVCTDTSTPLTAQYHFIKSTH